MSVTLFAKLTEFRLYPAAADDLDDIWRYSAESWSVEQADRFIDDLVRTFELLVSVPEIAGERKEFDPPVRIHVHGLHLIVYVIAGDHISILRVLGGRQDWRQILDALD
ncbi:type II toxin-antitoxin system RelE/ParE family toxin [Mesorhizobium sp. CAU 1741]|uniref:type II toxin-antitoxin system RelE/ParE family toxin n=1 Tax=Mesorhizobium sp. CAU 1741 TaxID=3140366 RepID=UPI00325AC2CE